MKKNIKNIYNVEMDGLNFQRFLNYSIQNNIKIKNLKRIENKAVFQVDINSLLNSPYDIKHGQIKLINQVGFNNFIGFFTKRIGLLIGVLCAIVLYFIFNNMILNINILGVEGDLKRDVTATLKSIGLKKYSFSKFQNDNLENFLKNEFKEISMVSVKKQGASYIINIKQKLDDVLQDSLDIIAPYNMLITKIEVFAGTQCVNVGDIVKKGQVLVGAYTNSGGSNSIKCEPIADIDGEIWFTNQMCFNNIEVVDQRTGKKIIETKFMLGDKLILSNNKKNSFKDYEIEEKEYYLSKILLPIRVKKVIYYEINKIEVEKNFEEQKEKVVGECLNNAYNNVPSGIQVIKEDVVITKLENSYIVDVYLKSNFSIRRKNDAN